MLMNMFIIMTLTLSLLFMTLNHPLAMGLTLLMQTLSVCLTSGLSSQSMWFPYILFLIYLGALLVLFIYVASLASNETFSPSLWPLPLLSMSCLILVTISWFNSSFHTLALSVENSCLNPSMLPYHNTYVYLSEMYNPVISKMTLFMMLYLLLTLIVVVNMTDTHSGPLRLN